MRGFTRVAHPGGARLSVLCSLPFPLFCHLSLAPLDNQLYHDHNLLQSFNALLSIFWRDPVDPRRTHANGGNV